MANDNRQLTSDNRQLATCVDCGRETAEADIFRVLRTDRAGRKHVVCRECSDRRHAETKPTPLQIQRTPPPHSVLGGKRHDARPGVQHGTDATPPASEE